ncbi:hypothetical protein RIF29_45461 [Crotalaria pallida]|uniref:Uncharacterized protein n=1 Tax=Crotalaria pallida TaxID=3830 RepID=A0AAN9DTH2_CROPI
MSYTLVLTFEGGDLEAIPVEVSPMTDFCIRYPNLIRKDIKMNSSSLCRAIRLAKRIDRSILKSIVTPSTGLPRQSQLIKEIVALSKDLILRSPWSTETAESTINSLSGLDTSVSLLTQAPLVDYRNLPRLALVRDGYSP